MVALHGVAASPSGKRTRRSSRRRRRSRCGLVPRSSRWTEADYKATRTSFFPSLHKTLTHIVLVDEYYLDALEAWARAVDLRQRGTVKHAGRGEQPHLEGRGASLARGEPLELGGQRRDQDSCGGSARRLLCLWTDCESVCHAVPARAAPPPRNDAEGLGTWTLALDSGGRRHEHPGRTGSRRCSSLGGRSPSWDARRA